VAYICATRRDPGAEPRSNSHTAQKRQQLIPQIRNLSPSRKLSSTAVTDVTAPCTNRDVLEDPAPTGMLTTFLDGMEVLNEFPVDDWKKRRGNNHTEPDFRPVQSSGQLRRTRRASSSFLSQLMNLQGLRGGPSRDRIVCGHQAFHPLGRPRLD